MPKILVAEDEPDIRELIVLTLQFSNFEVESVPNGLDAVNAAQNDHFDLILMDVRMPAMSGYEACRQLRSMDKTRTTPIIFLSAKGQESEVRTGLEAGADKYILKPFTPGELIEIVNQTLRK